MGWLTKRFKEDRSGLGNPNIPLGTLLLSSDLDTSSGLTVTPETAMRVVAFVACVRILSETVGSLPLHVYKRDADGVRTQLTSADDPRVDLVNVMPNPDMTAYDLWSHLMVNLCVYGNAFLYVDTDDTGAPIALWPLDPTKVKREKGPNGQLVWEVQGSESGFLYYQEIIPFKGMGLDPVVGLQPTRQSGQALGIAAALEEFAARTFKGDGQPGGVITSDRKLTNDEVKEFMTAYRAAHEGLVNSHKITLLQQGMNFIPNGFDPSQMQAIEARQFQTEDVARLTRVPPHLIGHPVTSSYNSIEQQSIEFLTYTIRPWLVNIQSRLTSGLFNFPKDQGRNLFVEFETAALLKSDTQAQAFLDKSDRLYGIRTSNEIREMRGLPPIDGGDALWMPVNTGPVGDDGLPTWGTTIPNLNPDTGIPGGAPDLTVDATDESQANDDGSNSTPSTTQK